MFNDNPTDYKNYSNTPVNRLVEKLKTDMWDILSVNCGSVTREMIHIPILAKFVSGFKNLYQWIERQCQY